jgi:hypothetical protein
MGNTLCAQFIKIPISYLFSLSSIVDSNLLLVIVFRTVNCVRQFSNPFLNNEAEFLRLCRNKLQSQVEPN